MQWSRVDLHWEEVVQQAQILKALTLFVKLLLEELLLFQIFVAYSEEGYCTLETKQGGLGV